MLKRSLFLLLATCLLFSLHANGQKEKTGTEDEKTLLRLAWWTNEVRTQITKDIIDLYQETNPQISIQPEFTGWGSYWEKLATQAAAGSLPDIIQMDLYGYLALYVEKEQLISLNPLIEKGALNISDLDRGPVDNGRVDGELYGVPLGVAPQAAVYDPEVFVKAGLAPPEPGWTWDDYQSLGKQLKEKTGVYLDSFQINNLIYEFQTYVKSFGSELYNVEGRLGFDKQLLVDYLQMKLELTEAGVLPTPDILRQHKELENSLLILGKAAIFSDAWSIQLGAIQKAAGRELELITRPSGTQGGIFNKPSMYWCITNNCQNLEVAADFVDFWINNEEANKIGTTNRGVPPSAKMRAAIAPILDDSSIKVMEYIKTASAIFAPLPPAQPAKSKEIGDLFNEVAEKVLFKISTVDQAAQYFISQANKILDQ